MRVRHAACTCRTTVEKLFGVCSIQATMARHTLVPDLQLHHQRTPSSVHLSECVRLCDTHTCMAVWSMVCNNIPRDIPERDPPCTYACTHVRTYVLCENRSSIQSLVLMRSAIMCMLTCLMGGQQKPFDKHWFISQLRSLEATRVLLKAQAIALATESIVY